MPKILNKEVNPANTTTVRLDSDIFRNFRAICIAQNKTPSRITEELIHTYTVQHIEEVSNHLNSIARKIKDG